MERSGTGTQDAGPSEPRPEAFPREANTDHWVSIQSPNSRSPGTGLLDYQLSTCLPLVS